ncbi:MAG: hypothetical protein ACPG8W_06050 [Candidatus Promineifilaceae bacterium]
MSKKSSLNEKKYPIVKGNELSEWVKKRAVFLFGAGDGVTKIESPLPPLSKLILITSDDGQDSLFFASGAD